MRPRALVRAAVLATLVVLAGPHLAQPDWWPVTAIAVLGLATVGAWERAR